MGQAARQMADPFLKHAEQPVSQPHLIHKTAHKQEGGQGQHVKISQRISRLLGKHHKGLVVKYNKLKGRGHHRIGNRHFQENQHHKGDKIDRQIRIQISQADRLLPFPPEHRWIHHPSADRQPPYILT